MNDTEILRQVADRFERSARFHSSPTLAEEDRTRAAAIHRVLARVAELEAACRTVLLALDRAPVRVDPKLTGLLAALTDARNKERP